METSSGSAVEMSLSPRVVAVNYLHQLASRPLWDIPDNWCIGCLYSTTVLFVDGLSCEYRDPSLNGVFFLAFLVCFSPGVLHGVGCFWLNHVSRNDYILSHRLFFSSSDLIYCSNA